MKSHIWVVERNRGKGWYALPCLSQDSRAEARMTAQYEKSCSVKSMKYRVAKYVRQEGAR